MDFFSLDMANFKLKVPRDIEDQIQSYHRGIESSKMAIYRFFDDEKKVKLHRKTIKQNWLFITKLCDLQNKAASYTLEGKLDKLQIEFETELKLGHTIENLYGLHNKIQAHAPLLQDIRKLARDSWYHTQYDNLDRLDPSGPLTQVQTTLIHYTQIYKSILEIEDKPKPEIIDDDDAFDGWLLIRSQNKETNKQIKSSKHNQAQEVFQFAGSQDEANRIYMSNNSKAQAVQQQRLKMLQESGGFVIK